MPRTDWAMHSSEVRLPHDVALTPSVSVARRLEWRRLNARGWMRRAGRVRLHRAEVGRLFDPPSPPTATDRHPDGGRNP